MPKTLLRNLSIQRSLQTPVGNLQNNSKPIELDLSALVQVGGGFGPNGTWLAAPAAPVKTLGPNGTW